jgi:hypothetical protein
MVNLVIQGWEGGGQMQATVLIALYLEMYHRSQLTDVKLS